MHSTRALLIMLRNAHVSWETHLSQLDNQQYHKARDTTQNLFVVRDMSCARPLVCVWHVPSHPWIRKAVKRAYQWHTLFSMLSFHRHGRGHAVFSHGTSHSALEASHSHVHGPRNLLESIKSSDQGGFYPFTFATICANAASAVVQQESSSVAYFPFVKPDLLNIKCHSQS